MSGAHFSNTISPHCLAPKPLCHHKVVRVQPPSPEQLRTIKQQNRLSSSPSHPDSPPPPRHGADFYLCSPSPITLQLTLLCIELIHPSSCCTLSALCSHLDFLSLRSQETEQESRRPLQWPEGTRSQSGNWQLLAVSASPECEWSSSQPSLSRGAEPSMAWFPPH